MEVIGPELILVTPDNAPAFNVAVPSVILVPSNTTLSTVNLFIVESPVEVIGPELIETTSDNAPPVKVAVPSVMDCAYKFLLKEASSRTNKRPLRDKSSATIN